uniref:RRM domain-containing protein n=1 Tax=Kalanchoe fedtschenkoi TaxID=63787 RepID=A0A7N0V7X8_KALFE
MAFSGRISGLLRRGLYNNSASSFAPVSPIVTRARNEPTYRLFVGGLGRGIDDQTLAEAFSILGIQKVLELLVSVMRIMLMQQWEWMDRNWQGGNFVSTL